MANKELYMVYEVSEDWDYPSRQIDFPICVCETEELADQKVKELNAMDKKDAAGNDVLYGYWPIEYITKES